MICLTSHTQQVAELGIWVSAVRTQSPRWKTGQSFNHNPQAAGSRSDKNSILQLECWNFSRRIVYAIFPQHIALRPFQTWLSDPIIFLHRPKPLFKTSSQSAMLLLIEAVCILACCFFLSCPLHTALRGQKPQVRAFVNKEKLQV